jgi:hypothetical protein
MCTAYCGALANQGPQELNPNGGETANGNQEESKEEEEKVVWL